MDLPRCAAAEPEHGWRCQFVPGHEGPHGVVWSHGRATGQRFLRRWHDGDAVVDTGRDRFGDLIAAADVSWALGCPAHEVPP